MNDAQSNQPSQQPLTQKLINSQNPIAQQVVQNLTSPSTPTDPTQVDAPAISTDVYPADNQTTDDVTTGEGMASQVLSSMTAQPAPIVGGAGVRKELSPVYEPVQNSESQVDQSVDGQSLLETPASQPESVKVDQAEAGAVTETGADNTNALEAGRGVQQVEVEPVPELPPEVEGYLSKVEQNTQQAPQEIVIADGSQPNPIEHHFPSQPVVILPITQKVYNEGKKKSPKYSVRWLVEWSEKIMKEFFGKVIYKQEAEK